ncbi:MAG: hypothetical protein O2780_18420 [Proteobacteria bacterium]|nr:hypothetical protein [Pseudomonadota bacterium]
MPTSGKKRRTKTNRHSTDRHSTGTTEILESARSPLTWAQRLKRVFDLDMRLCPNCGGRLRVIADVTDPVVIDKILSRWARTARSARPYNTLNPAPIDHPTPRPPVPSIPAVRRQPASLSAYDAFGSAIVALK